MNARGQYGAHGRHSSVHVGASLLHMLELKQRYEHVKTAAVQALLNDLSRDGTVSATATNRWEIALKNAGWVRLAWYPEFNGLELTITDRELWKPADIASVRRSYEQVLRRITAQLQSFGVTTVGSTIVGQTPAPRFAARTRAVRAVFDMYTHARAPYYIYAEVNGSVGGRSFSSLDEANAAFLALERSPGEIYAAIFDPTDPSWPGPAADVYHTAASSAAVGITLYHSVGDRADAVRQMDIDWNALYQSLASEVGEIPSDMSQVDWSKRPPAVQKAREEELAAWKAIDTAPAAEKPAAVKRAQELTARRGQLYLESFDPKKVAWWKSYASPLIKQWVKFKHEQLGGIYTTADSYIAFAERFQTNWDVYEDWKKKLDNLRDEAKSRGFAADTPKPTDLPTTVWADVAHTVERGAGAVAGGLGDAWTFIKYGLWGMLGIGAVVALSSVASNLRSGKDPAEKYVDLIKMRSRTAARAIAPPAAQLALAAGEES